MKKYKVVICILTIMVLVFNIQINVSNAADIEYADEAFEKIKIDAQRAAEKDGSTYVEKLAIYRAVVQDKSDPYLIRITTDIEGDEPTDELIKELVKRIDQEIQNAQRGEVSTPTGMTDEERKEVEDAVNSFIIANKNRHDYKALIKEKLEQNFEDYKIDYTQAQFEYRQDLYQAEYDSIIAKENVNQQIIDAQNMTEEELRREISRLETKLATYKNMPSSYHENGKTRDQLIAEYEILINEYTKIAEEKRYEAITGSSISSGVLGESTASGDHTVDDVINNANSFIEAGTNEGTKIDSSNLQTASNTLYNILLSIGIVVAVAVGMYLGVKFMLSSAEDKAKVKEALIPYIAGCVVIFGAFVIWKLAVTLLGGLS